MRTYYIPIHTQCRTTHFTLLLFLLQVSGDLNIIDHLKVKNYVILHTCGGLVVQWTLLISVIHRYNDDNDYYKL